MNLLDPSVSSTEISRLLNFKSVLIIPQYGTVSVYASRVTDAPGPDNYTQKVGPAGKLTGQDYMNSYFL